MTKLFENKNRVISFFHSNNNEAIAAAQLLEDEKNAINDKGLLIRTIFSNSEKMPLLLVGHISYRGIGKINYYIKNLL